MLLLEEFAVPEDPDDPQGEVDLWVVGTEVGSIGEDEAIFLRGTASLPARAVAELGTDELTRLLREDLLNSNSLKEARVIARATSAASRTTGVPDGAEAERN